MKPIQIRRQMTFLPDSARVIIRPFISGNQQLVKNIIARALALSEEAVEHELEAVQADFASRHYDIVLLLAAHYEKVLPHIEAPRSLSVARQLLIGALFSGEYALESAALFNPSIVPHPDQSGVTEGSLRFILSLRATGEGHISSIEFRTGIVAADGRISVEPVSPFVTIPDVVPNPTYDKKNFITKLHEMGFVNGHTTQVMAPLGDTFTLTELHRSMARVHQTVAVATHDFKRTLECMRWLAESNYELRFLPKLTMSERIIFPVSPNESNGIEDARFVRFIEADGSVLYYATYTAYNGRDILPQFIETRDFLSFRIVTLNGTGVQNKGMALFPRRIHGRFAMLSRQDDENLFIMFSDNIHRWNERILLHAPREVWEMVKIGNCGSPIETEAGWLVITHGVGAMRKYCIGALLLDINDPTVVLGSLREPLLKPEGNEREGYVPNVVYSCGSLIHARQLILSYAMSDKASVIASVSLDEILAALAANPVSRRG